MRWLARLFGVACLLIVLVIGLLEIAQRLYVQPGPLAAPAILIIPKGASSADIGAQLQGLGVVSSKNAFIVAAHLPHHKPIKAGEYEFAPQISLAGVIDQLQAGRVVIHHLTIPEGLTSAQIVQLMQTEPALSGEIPTTPPEGSLLPETYNFMLGDTRAAILGRMQAAATRELEIAWAARDPETLLKSPHEALVLASIVEKETGVPAERPLVAAVFINRLKQGMKLQSDPTVIYALDGGSGPLNRPLTHADLAIESPYNTYVIPGLPAQAICNPGKLALAAALHPDNHAYLYFVATGNGGHAFAETYEEHNRNVAQWIKTLHDRTLTSEQK